MISVKIEIPYVGIDEIMLNGDNVFCELAGTFRKSVEIMEDLELFFDNNDIEYEFSTSGGDFFIDIEDESTAQLLLDLVGLEYASIDDQEFYDDDEDLYDDELDEDLEYFADDLWDN